MAENLTPAERAKLESVGLRGTLKESLQDEHTGSLRDDDQLLMKFHGMYQQDDRDRREERAEKKLERLYSFMIRLRLPGGIITAQQWEELHHIAGRHSTGVIKITTRQTVQLHGILKSRIKPTLKEFYTLGLDSIAACGDVNRNVTCTAYPEASALHEEVDAFAKEISEKLLPKTRAYYEIWLDGEKLVETTEEDPLYQDRYLPRKFKIAVAVPPHNDVDVFTNDVGLIAVTDAKGNITGYNIAAGGGLGTTHGNSETYPRLATVLGYAPKDKALDYVYEIATTQRDFGNRADRKQARLKYTMDRMGVDVFKKEVESRVGTPFEAEKPYSFTHRSDLYGWHQNHKKTWFYTVFVENGRVQDEGEIKFKSAFLEIAEKGLATFRFTCNQNLILGDISAKNKKAVDEILHRYGIAEWNKTVSPVRKQAMACVAMNTCPLALAEGQRYLPTLITHIESLLETHQLQDENMTIRMTGCPNGCARPYISEIGFVGTALGEYNMHLGADVTGERLNKLYKESLNEEQILAELDALFGQFAAEKESGEAFGNFVVRKQLV
ncbi:MAG: NADPH-dependent assimilatory sulfite reductase hemoprotein subunit [Mucilaginibacter polytrichastri]|nr:NADPH-dependent assimilatory sulfite reductase hemoprotein subunit [Mucilaginibacter polytrichastri]